MTADIHRILDFVINSFSHLWPYLLLSIPLAVGVKMSGASRHIKRAFEGHPVTAVFFAVAVGAFSPFCSCGVIPVIASLLLGGVPLAPVMAFWIASPSMDPEIFLLSVASLGWKMATWRLAATLALSLLAGFATHLALRSGWLGDTYLRIAQTATPSPTIRSRIRDRWLEAKDALGMFARRQPVPAAACCGTGESVAALDLGGFAPEGQANSDVTCSDSCGSGTATGPRQTSCDGEAISFEKRLLREVATATWMVSKFMALAVVLGALTELYIPSEWIAAALGDGNSLSILTAAILGIPVYTSNLTALPLIGSLLSQGMDPGAAIAFLIAGPTTTLPAMAAVWGLVSRKVFALYVGFALSGALVFGSLYSLLGV
jgi:uncharacterized membrane protein YraQ (UPF0718 family)